MIKVFSSIFIYINPRCKYNTSQELCAFHVLSWFDEDQFPPYLWGYFTANGQIIWFSTVSCSPLHPSSSSSFMFYKAVYFHRRIYICKLSNHFQNLLRFSRRVLFCAFCANSVYCSRWSSIASIKSPQYFITISFTLEVSILPINPTTSMA